MSLTEAIEHLRAGRAQEAAGILESYLRNSARDAQGWRLLGACRSALGDFKGAAAALAKCLQIEPRELQAHLARIAALQSSGDASAALKAVAEATQVLPGQATLHFAAALSLEDLARPSEALAQYDRALAIDGTLEDALHNRGVLLSRLGLLEQSEANQRHYIAAFPQASRAHEVLADVLIAARKFDSALVTLDAMERLAPQDVAASVRRGVALSGLRRYNEARRTFADAVNRDPQGISRFVQKIAPGVNLDYAFSPENLFLWQCWLALSQCDWSVWNDFAAELRRLPGDPSIHLEPAAAYMAFHLPLSGAERLAVARHIAADIEKRRPPMQPPLIKKRGRIKLAILSPDFREHLNAYLLLPLFELLDRSRFELHAYSLVPDDGSEIRTRLGRAADHFHDLHALSDVAAAAAIRADEIDILVDAAGHTTDGKFAITAQRPARVQALYLGFAGSLGSTRVDAALTDRVAGGDPEEWVEGRVFLPDTYYLYDFRRPPTGVQLSRAEYSLPESAFVFCAFHKAEKISPDTFLLWTNILALVPGSVLWLLALPPAAQQNLRREAARHGLDPARLVFAPFDTRERYLARQRLGDLMLDAVHHSAMTTACDALAAGLPVLTVRGAAMASRAGESLARAAGVPELVAQDKDTYVAQAVRLASDAKALADLRHTLLARTGPLFDTAGRVRALEAAFQGMVERMLRGEPRSLAGDNCDR